MNERKGDGAAPLLFLFLLAAAGGAGYLVGGLARGCP